MILRDGSVSSAQHVALHGDASSATMMELSQCLRESESRIVVISYQIISLDRITIDNDRHDTYARSTISEIPDQEKYPAAVI